MTHRIALRICTLLAASLLVSPVALAEPLGPGAPGNLVAVATAPGEISLAWGPAPSLAGVSAYRIYHVASDGALALAAEVAGDARGWSETGLAPGVTATYVVSAVDLLGEGPASDPASATTWDVPSAPTKVAVASGPGALGEANVTWAEPESDGGAPVLAYAVYRDDELVAMVDAETFAFVDAGLTPLHAYAYRVSAVNAVGEGAASEAACGVPSPWTPELGCQGVL